MKMDVVVANHPSSLLHDTGPRHPERPARVEAVARGIEDAGLVIHGVVSPSIDVDELSRVHGRDYIEMIEAACRQGGGALDMDTFVSPASWEAALTSAGGVLALVEELETRGGATGFALTRPPGHHALARRAMGFCLFNNVAVTAAHLRARGKTVAILDWDVHHGNGTQAMLGADAGALYVSIHQADFYPFAGEIDDIESADGEGTVVNIPLPAGTAGDVYRRAWSELVIPVLTQFEPDWVLVSAGYDAHAFDHLADLRLDSDDYGWMASQLAAAHPVDRTIFALEGGYDLDALRESTRSTLLGLSGEAFAPDGLASPPGATPALARAATAIARHWVV
jgi:acetoin utilization deacetylase AcuC-like enzyme